MINHEVNGTGIAITVSVTTVTQVQSLFVSYIAYGSDLENIYLGQYIYDAYAAAINLAHIPNVDISKNLVDFYGFNGFILGNNRNSFALTAKWSGNQFNFLTNSNYRYISFTYFFMLGSSCSNCKNNPIFYQDKCLSYCPLNTNYTGKTCVECSISQKFNGTGCADKCHSSTGKIWDNFTQSCVCPAGQSWNDISCITCPNGKTWNSNSRTCECPISSTWNGSFCIICIGGQRYNQ